MIIKEIGLDYDVWLSHNHTFTRDSRDAYLQPCKRQWLSNEALLWVMPANIICQRMMYILWPLLRNSAMLRHAEIA